MATAKIVEVIAEGSSVENAIENGVKDVTKTVNSVQSVWVDNIQAVIRDQKITAYRVNLKITFIVNN
ncbi:MAG: dodecin domain-containing protein [Chlamydiia bacterium]|nr:dodecin domain-containing protein [Chlamydiia bacterium]